MKTIGGAIHFDGDFKETRFPNLKLVKCSTFVKTFSAEMDCNKWIRPLDGGFFIHGGKLKYTSQKKQVSVSLAEDSKIIDIQENESKSEKANVTIIPNKATSSCSLK